MERYNLFMEDAIHISMYPSVPYNTCAFYLSNVAGNSAREDLYDLAGTPVVILDGKKGASQPSEADYTAAINKPADYSITFEDPNPADVKITIQTLKDLPDGATIVAWMALTEKIVQFNAPNGETTHYDVFRKFLRDGNAGEEIVFPSGTKAGDMITHSFGEIDYPVSSYPDFSLVTYINLKNSLDILQAETAQIGPGASTNKFEKEKVALTTFPNPVKDVLNISWNTDSFNPQKIQIFNEYGQEVSNQAVISSKNKTTIDVQTLTQGMYLFRLVDANSKIGYGKFIVK